MIKNLLGQSNAMALQTLRHRTAARTQDGWDHSRSVQAISSARLVNCLGANPPRKQHQRTADMEKSASSVAKVAC